MSAKTYFQKGSAGMIGDNIPVDEFDKIVDDGYDLIVITTSKERFTASVDDWLDFGYIDLTDDDTEVRVLHRAYMSKM